MTPLGKLIFGSIILLGVGGGGWYFISKPEMATGTPVATIEQATTTLVVPTGKKIPFSRLMEQGGTYKCTVNQHVANMDTTGTVYMDNMRVRGEFTITTLGKNIDSTFIMKDSYMNSWTSMAPTMGFKIKIPPHATTTEPQSTTVSASGTYSWNAEQIGDYNCEAWTVDETSFTLPSGIKFKEMK